jgi:hypothetical protein
MSIAQVTQEELKKVREKLASLQSVNSVSASDIALEKDYKSAKNELSLLLSREKATGAIEIDYNVLRHASNAVSVKATTSTGASSANVYKKYLSQMHNRYLLQDHVDREVVKVPQLAILNVINNTLSSANIVRETSQKPLAAISLSAITSSANKISVSEDITTELEYFDSEAVDYILSTLFEKIEQTLSHVIYTTLVAAASSPVYFSTGMPVDEHLLIRFLRDTLQMHEGVSRTVIVLPQNNWRRASLLRNALSDFYLSSGQTIYDYYDKTFVIPAESVSASRFLALDSKSVLVLTSSKIVVEVSKFGTLGTSTNTTNVAASMFYHVLYANSIPTRDGAGGSVVRNTILADEVANAFANLA